MTVAFSPPPSPAPSRIPWYRRTVPTPLFLLCASPLLVGSLLAASPLAFLPGAGILALLFPTGDWLRWPSVVVAWVVGATVWMVALFAIYHLARLLVFSTFRSRRSEPPDSHR